MAQSLGVWVGIFRDLTLYSYHCWHLRHKATGRRPLEDVTLRPESRVLELMRVGAFTLIQVEL